MHGIDEGELEIGPSDTTPVLYSTEGVSHILDHSKLNPQYRILSEISLDNVLEDSGTSSERLMKCANH